MEEGLEDYRTLGISRLPWYKLGAKEVPPDICISFKGLIELVRRSGNIGY